MKRKLFLIFLFAVILITGGFFGYRYWFDQNHVRIEGADIPCTAQNLILQGDILPSRESLSRLTELQYLDVRSVPLTVEEYEQLSRDFPDLEIPWLVPFQGRYLPTDTTELTVETLSEADLDVLPYFPGLARIRIRDCRDYELLLELEARSPQPELSYFIGLNGTVYSNTEAAAVTALTLENADISELSQVLPFFKQLNEVVFTGTVPENEAIYELMCAHPEVSFQWELELFGIRTSNMAESLDLSGIPMESTEEVESYLKYFPKLNHVDMCETGIPSDQMDPLSQRHPQIRFVWTIKIGMGTLRTDATGFIPYKLGHTRYVPLYDEDCTELKYCIDLISLDMGHMKITDISFLEHMPNLKYLIVADIPCSDFSPIASLKELIYLEIFKTSFDRPELLLELTKLEDLNISVTPIDSTEELKQMTWLKRLWMVSTGMNSAQYWEIKEALPDTKVVMPAEHSTARGWRKAQNYYDMRDLLGMFYMD